MSSAVSNGLGFASYETGLSFYRRLNEGVSPSPAERGVIAGVAATLVMAAIQPLEVIMRRMQVRTVPCAHAIQYLCHKDSTKRGCRH